MSEMTPTLYLRECCVYTDGGHNTKTSDDVKWGLSYNICECEKKIGAYAFLDNWR
jgi:hypothetical protein